MKIVFPGGASQVGQFSGARGDAVADWAIAHEDTTDTPRGVRTARFGGTPQEQPERYAASSPITYAKDVQASLLITQGRNDTRTPHRSVDVYEATMKALGLVVDQAIEHHALMLDFARRVLARAA
jgi:Prolyl oligopeptidase family